MELAVETFRVHVVLHSLLVRSCIGSSSRIVVSPTRRFAYPAHTRNANTGPHDRHPQEHGGLHVLFKSQSGTQMVGAHQIRALARCVPCSSTRLRPIFQIAGLLPYLAYIPQLKAGRCLCGYVTPVHSAGPASTFTNARPICVTRRCTPSYFLGSSGSCIQIP